MSFKRKQTGDAAIDGQFFEIQNSLDRINKQLGRADDGLFANARLVEVEIDGTNATIMEMGFPVQGVIIVKKTREDALAHYPYERTKIYVDGPNALSLLCLVF